MNSYLSSDIVDVREVFQALLSSTPSDSCQKCPALILRFRGLFSYTPASNAYKAHAY